MNKLREFSTDEDATQEPLKRRQRYRVGQGRGSIGVNSVSRASWDSSFRIDSLFSFVVNFHEIKDDLLYGVRKHALYIG